MKLIVLFCSSMICLAVFALADGKPQYKSSLDYIQKTGKLWGVSEVRLNTNATVTLVDAKKSGYGYGLMMFTSENKVVDSVTLGVSQFCNLSDGHHATLLYKFKSAKDGVIHFEVTDRFDASSFGDGVKEQKGSVSVKPYKD